jgi:hypothetical protein
VKKRARAERITIQVQISSDRSVEFSLERKRRDRWEVCSRYPGERAWTLVKSLSGTVNDVVLWCETTYFADPDASFRKREANLRAFGSMLDAQHPSPASAFVEVAEEHVTGLSDALVAVPSDPDAIDKVFFAARAHAQKLEEAFNVLKGKLAKHR